VLAGGFIGSRGVVPEMASRADLTGSRSGLLDCVSALEAGFCA